MNIQIPQDFKLQANELKDFVDETSKTLINSLKSVLPVGYTITNSRNYLTVQRSESDVSLTGSPRLYLHSTSIITKFGTALTINDNATAEDIFKLCPIMQILQSINITMLPEFTEDGTYTGN